MQVVGPNVDQIEFWNGLSGGRWVRFQEQQDDMLRPLGHRAMAVGLPRAGERVLDLGCGCGDTTIDLAGKVAPTGSVVGVDVSAVMLARARERIAESDLDIAFIEDDAQIRAFPRGSFDLLFSRFGIMFFADPRAAFMNLRLALDTAGRVAFVCWRARNVNPWMMIPVQTAARHLPPPQPSPPRAPGPFAFAERDYVLEIMRATGFRDIDIGAHDEPLPLGDNIESAVGHAIRLGPMAQHVAAAPADVQSRVRDELHEALVPYLTDEGVRVPSGSWLVTARAS